MNIETDNMNLTPLDEDSLKEMKQNMIKLSELLPGLGISGEIQKIMRI